MLDSLSHALMGVRKSWARRSMLTTWNLAPNLQHAWVVESPYAHAKILSNDPSEAEKVPGVVKIVTGKDFPYHFGL
jgi:carbon-monoxide dehydrogenase large subunit